MEAGPDEFWLGTRNHGLVHVRPAANGGPPTVDSLMDAPDLLHAVRFTALGDPVTPQLVVTPDKPVGRDLRHRARLHRARRVGRLAAHGADRRFDGQRRRLAGRGALGGGGGRVVSTLIRTAMTIDHDAPADRQSPILSAPLPFARNSVAFDYAAGTFALGAAPRYQTRMVRTRSRCRRATRRVGRASRLSVSFRVLPPWQRTW